MSCVWKMMMMVAVALIPGAFMLLLAYITTRTLWARWHEAQEQAQLSGVPVSMWEVLTTLHFKELVHQARTAF